MNRRNVFMGAVAAIGVVALWWVFVFSPKGKALDDAHTKLASAKQQSQTLNAELAELRDLARRSKATEAQVSRLNAAIPKKPNQASFITALNGIAGDSGITWQSVTMQPPTAGGPAPLATAVQIKLGGGFSQVVGYLNRLEDLNRLVVVDSVTLDPGDANSAGGGGSAASAAPDSGVTSRNAAVSVTLNGRVFSETALDDSTPAGATTGTAGSTTGSGGSTAGTTATTAVSS